MVVENGRLTIKQEITNGKNKVYGVGVYVAKHALYSDVLRPYYCGNGQRQLILTNVALGNCKDYMESNAPETKAIAPNGYHSVSGTEGNMAFMQGWIDKERQKTTPSQRLIDDYQALLDNGAKYGRQYVVNRSNQAYPAYLVTYGTP